MTKYKLHPNWKWLPAGVPPPQVKLDALTPEQIAFMRGEASASGPRVFLPLLDAGYIRVNTNTPPLFVVTERGTEAIAKAERSR